MIIVTAIPKFDQDFLSKKEKKGHLNELLMTLYRWLKINGVAMTYIRTIKNIYDGVKIEIRRVIKKLKYFSIEMVLQ